MIKDVVKVLIALGLFCVLISILFRFYVGLYTVPLINVTPDATLRFANTIFLAAISLGIYDLLKSKK